MQFTPGNNIQTEYCNYFRSDNMGSIYYDETISKQHKDGFHVLPEEQLVFSDNTMICTKYKGNYTSSTFIIIYSNSKLISLPPTILTALALEGF